MEYETSVKMSSAKSNRGRKGLRQKLLQFDD